MRARAVVLEQVGSPPSIRDIEVAAPGPGEVLVKMLASGICHTDLAVGSGHLPTQLPCVLGHEGAGVIEQLGASDTSDLRVGDQVLLSFDFCDQCSNCTSGLAARCHSWGARNFGRSGVGGPPATAFTDVQSGQPIGSSFFGHSSFASHSIVAVKCCVKMPKDIDLRLFASLGCGGQTGAGTVLNVLKPRKESSILITGLGAVGMSALMAAVHLGISRIIAVDVVPSRCALALELGATHVLDGRSSDILAQVRALGRDGLGVDAVVECSGVMPCMAWAWQALAYCGRMAQVGTPGRGKSITLPLDDIMSQGKTLIGIVEGHVHPPTFVPQLVAHHQQGRFPLERISQFFDFERYDDAVAAMKSGEVIKPILVYP